MSAASSELVMYFNDVLRSQFGAPSGLIGTWVMGPFLNVVNRPLMSSAVEALEPRPGERVLDVGFGGGYSLLALAERVPSAEVVGVDYSRDMVERAAAMIRARRPRPNIRVQWGDVGKLPFESGSFDRALAVSTIYYWPDLGAGLREIARVLRPGGRLSVGFRDAWSLRLLTLGWSDFKLYEPHQVIEAMGEAGFREPRVAKRGDWLGPDTVVVIGESPKAGAHAHAGRPRKR